MNNYSGNMDGEIYFTSPKPFVLLDWPSQGKANPFDSEEEARQFIEKQRILDRFVTFARFYGFSGGEWKLLQTNSPAISSKLQA